MKNQTSIRILIVGDPSVNLSMIRLLQLRFLSLIPSDHSNRVSAVSEIDQQAPFDLVITGTKMPFVGDASVVIDAVRKKSLETKIIVVSGVLSKEEGARLGADGFLEKPYDNADLCAMIVKLVPTIEIKPSVL